ncbi:60S ribosomal protein L6B [Orobanche minor]
MSGASLETPGIRCLCLQGEYYTRDGVDHSGRKVSGEEGCLFEAAYVSIASRKWRVNQTYVIGTSTKVDISVVNLDKFDDKYFSRQVEKKKRKGENEFFGAEKEKRMLSRKRRRDDHKVVDAPLLKAVEAVPNLKAYLGARFSLMAGMKPHELVF